MATERTCRNQFRDFPVPVEIDQLVPNCMLVDTSWGNDICPSFEMHRAARGIRLWVDHPQPNHREMHNPERFIINPLVWNESEGTWMMPDPTPILLRTNSVLEVLSYIAQFDRAYPEGGES